MLIDNDISFRDIFDEKNTIIIRYYRINIAIKMLQS